MVAELFKLTRSFYSKKSGAPGNTLTVEGSGLGKSSCTFEGYQHHGFTSRPPKGARVVVLPVGEGRRVMVSIAEHDYNLDLEVGDGETTIYSTSADGKTLKAQIALDASGKIKIANATKSLATILSSLLNHLEGLTTVNCVQGSPVTLNPATTANLEQDKANLALLLKE